jgi:hypothetical protein
LLSRSIALARAPAQAAKAAKAAVEVADGSHIYLECHEGTSNKFYRMKIEGSDVIAAWGACLKGARLRGTVRTPVRLLLTALLLPRSPRRHRQEPDRADEELRHG